MAKGIWDKLNKIDGGGRSKTRGARPTTRRGITAKSVDRPTPFWITEAIEEVAPYTNIEPAEAPEADTRSPLAKKYDVRDRVARVTPERFRDLFCRNNFRGLLELFDQVEIDDGKGFRAMFSYACNDTQNFRPVTAPEIKRRGVSACLKDSQGIIILPAASSQGRQDPIGYIQSHSMSSELGANVRAIEVTDPSVVHEASGPTGVNFSKAFNSTDHLKAFVHYHREPVGVLIVYQDPRERLILGRLYHPSVVKTPLDEFERTDVPTFRSKGLAAAFQLAAMLNLDHPRRPDLKPIVFIDPAEDQPKPIAVLAPMSCQLST